MNVQLNEILTAELLQTHAQHIRDYLEMEDIAAADDLGQTVVGERAAKELVAELAHDVDQRTE